MTNNIRSGATIPTTFDTPRHHRGTKPLRNPRSTDTTSPIPENTNSIHCDETNRASCRVRPLCRSTNNLSKYHGDSCVLPVLGRFRHTHPLLLACSIDTQTRMHLYIPAESLFSIHGYASSTTTTIQTNIVCMRYIRYTLSFRCILQIS